MPGSGGARRLAGPERRAGFTLLELLVALVVFGLLMVGLTGGLRFGVQAYDRQARAIDATGDLDAVDRALRRLIAQMEQGSARDRLFVRGSDRALSFTTELPAAAGALATRRIEAALLVDGAHRLVLRWVPRPHDVPLAPPPTAEEVLLRGVAAIRIAYLPQEAGAGWVNDWNGLAVPRLVRLHIAFVPGDPRRWPDIVAAPAQGT